MRISLQPDPAELVKQIADLRRFLNRQDAMGGQAAASARLMTASYVPMLAALRSELRDDAGSLPQTLTAMSDLIGNMAMTLVQSMFDAPPEAQEEAIDRILGGAKATALGMIENDARMARDIAAKAKPKLAILNGGKP